MLLDKMQTVLVGDRPHLFCMQAEDAGNGEGRQSTFASRTAVLADAQGLLTCYGVGEDGSANLPHAVVELCFTSSVRFLQPGLLLKVTDCNSSIPKLVLCHVLNTL